MGIKVPTRYYSNLGSHWVIPLSNVYSDKEYDTSEWVILDFSLDGNFIYSTIFSSGEQHESKKSKKRLRKSSKRLSRHVRKKRRTRK